MPLQSSTLPSSAAPKILLHTISVCPPGFASPVTLPSHPPSTAPTRSTKTASRCELGRRHETNGFLERPRRLQDVFSTTESLRVARHAHAQDWFQLANSIPPQNTKKTCERPSRGCGKSFFTTRQVRVEGLQRSAHSFSATALAESSLDVQVRTEQLTAKQWSRRQQQKTCRLVQCVYKLQESLWEAPEL